MEFRQLKRALRENFAEISKDATHLFEINVDKDEFWNLYLDSYPEGSNEIFRERREHDCSCCRQFIRNIGNAVILKNGVITTIWDFNTGDTTYQTVVDALSVYVKSQPITDIYISKFKKIGTDKNYEELVDGTATLWEHFYLELPDRFVDKSDRTEGDIKGSYRATKDVFKGSLDKISEESVSTVLELISSNSLYKGEEWAYALKDFLVYKKAYDKLQTEEDKNIYTWEQSVKVGEVVGRIKNHSMGTLLLNITEGMDLDLAVKKYEAIVAPENYKRSKPIYTAKMLEDAKKTIEELGYMDSLSRRYATLDDITVNNILFSNKDSAMRIINANVFDEMSNDIATNPKKFSKVEEVAVDDFVKNVLPNAREIEVLLENKHQANMMSLIAPGSRGSKSMFKWDNNFSWAYAGNITDSSMAQMVRDAGGRTDGVLRFSHSWNYEGMRNGSLMDLHVFMPGSNQSITTTGGKEIHDNYGNDERVGWNHRQHPLSGGIQDVDYVKIAPEGHIPVENITFPSMDRLKDGIYIFKIHNWHLRHPTYGGFKAEIAFGGQIYKFERKQPLAHKEWITLAKIELKNGEFKILEMMENEATSIEVWNLKTNNFVPVSVICYSPNYWNEQSGVGHRHYFFMLKNCINSEEPNGFYNEFLNQQLFEHRKVMEALGGKMRVECSEDQLSGLGFSSTKRNELVVRVKGSVERIIKIKF